MTNAVFNSDNIENGINLGMKKMKFEVIYTSEQNEEEQTWTYITPYTMCHLEYLMEEFVNFCIENHLTRVGVTDTNFWDYDEENPDFQPELYT